MTTTRHQISNHDIKSLIRAGSSGLVIYGNCSGLHLTVLSGGPWFIHKKRLLFNQNNKLSLTGPVLGVLGITKGISVHPGSSREEAHYCRSCKLKQSHPDCDKDQWFLLSSQPEAPPTSIKQLRGERWTQSTLILNDTPPLWWVYENIITTQWVSADMGSHADTCTVCIKTCTGFRAELQACWWGRWWSILKGCNIYKPMAQKWQNHLTMLRKHGYTIQTLRRIP